MGTSEVFIGYNTLMVCLGAMSLGIAGGVVGLISVQRGQALLSDTLAHAALPGVALAWGLSGLILGAQPMGIVLAGGAGSACLAALWLRFMSSRRAMTLDMSFAATLSVFFGGGLILVSWIQSLNEVGTAGLSFIFLGQITSLTGADLVVTSSLASAASLSVAALYRPLRHLCFDETHAKLIGLPTRLLDQFCVALALCVALCGLYLVGLVLTVAMLILPAASASFWSKDFRVQLITSGAMGGFSGLSGALLSAHFEKLPSGPLIVLCGGGLLTISLAWHALKTQKDVFK